VPSDVSGIREAERRRREAAANAKSRLTSATTIPAPTAIDPSAFPGGVVPAAMPMKRLGGVVRTRGR
jgi:hypothetical protein